MRWLLSILFVLSIILSPTARAQTALRYAETTSDIRASAFLDSLADHGFDATSPYRIASIDLNGDGVDEWIVTQGFDGCAARASCGFFIGGLSDRQPVLLGQFRAGRIEVLDTAPNGINHLAVFENPNDDYDYRRYAYDPKNRAFLPL